ncbi:MAG: TDP-N-acetylfucosamine:lipid II N-acetylfucosaminyltransferase [Giesbergeria sp.]|nr:TDP-N-acetylfucosamine:lipid II N-acetylfucosaminyltransferase [Giesbergeria sp.]
MKQQEWADMHSSDLGYIVHITHDDKFIDMALREFEAVAPGIHKPVIFGKQRSLRYVKSKSVCFHTLTSAKTLINLPDCKAVVFHAMPDLTLLAHISIGKQVIWLGWGYDYYDRLLSGVFPEGLYQARTRQLMHQRPAPNPIRWAARKVKTVLKLILRRAERQDVKLLTRVDIFSPVIDVEHKMACELNAWFKPHYVTWNYGTLEDDMLAEGQSCGVPLGPHILVGNSASFENNHLEIFEYLAHNFDLTGVKIYVPLSYGDDWYKDQIIAAGRAKFGDQFVPLTDFMAKDAYINLLQSCGHVFMNHLRQQALGNICIMMLKGAKLYMNPASPLYRWLLDKGAVVQAIAEPIGLNHPTPKQTLIPLTQSEQDQNYSMIQAHWGRDQQRHKTRQLINLAMSTV